jgi:phage tail-like protein
MILTNRAVKSRYVGLDIYRARKRIIHDFPQLEENQIDIHYVESPYPRFTVLKSVFNESKNKIELEASSSNPIRHLPSNYYNNDFLHGFLMIFQHIMNDTTITLDNMHDYFRPMESPVGFLPVLADWLGIHLDTLGEEEEVRHFLQYAIPLYRYRGTKIGLKAHLKIITGTVPEIIEGTIPYSAMLIDANTESESNLMDSDDQKNSFTVHFTVPRNKFSDSMIQRLSLIVQREKPAHTKAYISFEKARKKTRTITTINTDTVMGVDDGITL